MTDDGWGMLILIFGLAALSLGRAWWIRRSGRDPREEYDD